MNSLIVSRCFKLDAHHYYLLLIICPIHALYMYYTYVFFTSANFLTQKLADCNLTTTHVLKRVCFYYTRLYFCYIYYNNKSHQESPTLCDSSHGRCGVRLTSKLSANSKPIGATKYPSLINEQPGISSLGRHPPARGLRRRFMPKIHSPLALAIYLRSTSVVRQTPSRSYCFSSSDHGSTTRRKGFLFFVIVVFVDLFEVVVESQVKGTRYSRIDRVRWFF
jgi:hypothetical protein